jgi:CheY-like chemotaxis protein
MSTRILIIDDMPGILALLSVYLDNQGYEVMTAQNGEEALQVLEHFTPALIISDIMMPRMGGFEFIEQCRRNNPYGYIPIIVVSAKDRASTETIAAELGADGFLEKPINLDLLQKAIEATLAKALAKAKWVPENNATAQANLESRRTPRANFLCEAYFEGGGISGLTIVSNLSRGGCSLDIYTTIPVGTILFIRMKVQPGRIIEVVGEVRYSEARTGAGIEFINIDRSSGELIDRIVESLSGQNHNAVNAANAAKLELAAAVGMY